MSARARRPRWFWEELIEKFEAGEETQGGFAEKHGANLSTFKRWLYQLRAEKACREGPGFVEVKHDPVLTMSSQSEPAGGFVQVHIGRCLVMGSTHAISLRLSAPSLREVVLSLPPSVKIYLSLEPTDMRKGFDGLFALVKAAGMDPFSEHLFVFVSKRRNRAKILCWDTGGFVLFYKRLEQGRFKLPKHDDAPSSITLERAELSMLFDGIDYSRFRKPKRWHPTASSL